MFKYARLKIKLFVFVFPQESEVPSIIRHRGTPRRSLGNYKKNPPGVQRIFWGSAKFNIFSHNLVGQSINLVNEHRKVKSSQLC